MKWEDEQVAHCWCAMRLEVVEEETFARFEVARSLGLAYWRFRLYYDNIISGRYSVWMRKREIHKMTSR